MLFHSRSNFGHNKLYNGPLSTVLPTAARSQFLHQCAHWCRPFKSVLLPEKAECFRTRLFLFFLLNLDIFNQPIERHFRNSIIVSEFFATFFS